MRLLDLLYLAAYALMAPLILWRRVAQGRSLGNPGQRVFGVTPPLPRDDARVVWMHAVSVGEVNQLGALLEQFRHRHPEVRLVISTTTATGMKLAREKFPDVTTFYFPIDFSWAVARALRRIRPALLVLTELELWPNLLAAASRRDVPVAVINGRLSERSARNYGKAARLVRPMFSSLAAVVTQDEDYAARFIALGTAPHRVHVVGSLKFDNAVREAAIIRDQRNEELQQLRKLIDLRAGDRLFVAGSTQEPEEAMAGRVYQALAGQFPDARLRLVVVPRHPHRAAEVQRRMEQTGIRAVLKTEPGAWPATSPDGIPAVLIVNTIGELGMWWSLADVAFVGGSFGNRGGQNMLEPAAAGCASCFGPNTWNFARIAADMKAVAAAIEVTNEEELRMFVERCLDDDDYFRRLTQLGRQFVEFRCGATDRYVAHLSRLLTRRIAANKRSAA